MSDLQALGRKALAMAPQPLQRALDGINVQFRGEGGPTQSIASGSQSGNLAGVLEHDPNTINVMDHAAFQKAPDQLVTHEGMHLWQNNLPPSIQKAIPADNPADPYNYGGDAKIARLAQSGQSILALPKEQEAAAMQYYQAQGGDQSAPKALQNTYGKLAKTINDVPLSQIEMTAPDAKELNMHPRAPKPPAMMPAKETYAKGDAAPGDDASAWKPVEESADSASAWKAVDDAAPADDRNGFQKMVDAATERHDPNYAQMGPISKALDNFGRGAAGAMLTPIAHPLNALQGIASTVAHPVDAAQGIAKSIGDDYKQNGAMTIPYALGQAGGMLISSEAGAPIAKAMKAAAPGVAEGALGISKVDRAYGKTPGRAILDETRGVRPATIERTAGERLNQLGGQVNDMADQYPGQVDITPARDHVQGEINKAARQNNLGGIKALEPVRGQLANVLDTNQPLSAYQSARDVLELKRGLRNQFVKNWNPDAGSALQRDTARGASGVLDKQLDSALGPEFAKTNQRIASLIPVKDAAESVQRNAPMAQRVSGRLKAHTGALAGGVAGALAGAAHGGPIGGAIGGAVGLALPEAVSAPAFQMGIARTLDSPVAQVIPKALATVPSVGSKAKKKGDE